MHFIVSQMHIIVSSKYIYSSIINVTFIVVYYKTTMMYDVEFNWSYLFQKAPIMSILNDFLANYGIFILMPEILMGSNSCTRKLAAVVFDSTKIKKRIVAVS